MNLGNYKIKVTTEAESREVCALLEQLGISEGDFNGFHVPCIIATLGNKYSDYAANTLISRKPRQELTIPQLRDLVVLHRNDVSDANHIKNDGEMFGYLSSDNIEYTWNFVKNNWFKSSIYFSDSGLKPINRELISGADALRALADGKGVEYLYGDKWLSVVGEQVLITAITNDKFKFRLKPCTITLNIEIPAPFEPKNGEIFWILNTERECGYKQSIHHVGVKHDLTWKSEHDIQQVVSALRGALKNG